MTNTQNRKVLKTMSYVALATVFANVSNAWFWDDNNDRAVRTNALGQEVPAIKESWLDRATTYHEELKPEYDAETQRVKMPTSPIYDGVTNRTGSSTVKPAWYDQATTYHEEQRRPWNPYAAEEKKVPAYMYYDKKEAKLWNEHYSQQGLEPVPYMYGSASLVLRKERQASEYELQKGENLDGLKDLHKSEADARMVGMEKVYIRPVGGFESIDKRDNQNQLASNRSRNIMLSDPVEKDRDVSVYNNVMIGNPKKFDVQAATQIKKPKTDWRAEAESKPSMARPGDFDYKATTQKAAQAYAHQQAGNYGQDIMPQGGEVIASTATLGEGRYPAGSSMNNAAMQGGVEKVNNYVVENGDTLSEISDKEKIYGDWTLWPLIYDANRSQVKDPDLIRPGQDLDIPRDYAYEQESDARYRAKNREMPISLYDNR